MGQATYTPITFNGASLTGATYRKVYFGFRNGPAHTRPFVPVEAEVAGLGDRFVRQQPKGQVWELHVELGSITQVAVDAFYQVFTEASGLVYMQANDGDNNAWRCQMAVVRIQAISPFYFIVHMRVPDPTWEQLLVTTTNKLGMSGEGSGSFTLTNDGNRPSSRLVFAVTPRATKQSYYHDFLLKSFIFIVNRSPLFWNNLPIQLADVSGGDGAHDHAALVGKTQTRALLAGAIDGTQTTIVYDNGQSGLLPEAGIAFIQDEQIAWSGGGGAASGTLTGVDRGVGGTAAVGHADNAFILHSEALQNGDDVRVFLNHVEVERWLSGVNTNAMRIWANVSMPPGESVRLLADITAGSPASGGDLEVKDDISGYPESGVLNIAGGEEAISYQSLDRVNKKFKTIERGAWTTPASAASEDGLVYRVDVLGVVTCGKGRAENPPDRITHRPAIQMGATNPSKNAEWRYADAAADALSVIHDPDNPDRTAMFHPSYEVPASDGNKAEPLQLSVSAARAEWKSADAEAGKPSVGRLVVDLPQAIKIGTDTIEYDVRKRRDIRLRILGQDIQGLETELADEQDVDEATETAQKLTPKAPIYKLILNGVWANVLGENNLTTNDIASGYANAVGEGYMQKFILDQTTDIVAVATRLRKNDAGDDFEFTVHIIEDGGTANIRDGRALGVFGTGGTLLASGLTTNFKWYQWTKPNGDPLRLAAGTYWLQIKVSVLTSGALKGEAALISTRHNELWVIENSLETQAGNFCMPFMIIHAGGGPIQPEVIVVQEGALANFDKLILTLDDGASTRKVPFVHRTGALANSGPTAYHCVAKIRLNEVDMEVDIDLWMEPDASLTIDIDSRTAIYLQGFHKIDVAAALKFNDLEKWLQLRIGANATTYTELDILDTDLVVTHRGVKV